MSMTVKDSPASGVKVDVLSGVPEGLDAFALGEIAAAKQKEAGGKAPVLLHLVRDDRRVETLKAALGFFAPGLRVMRFPAWDCVPYDRISPNSEIVAERLDTLARLAAAERKAPTIVIATVNAILQRVATRTFVKRSLKTLAPQQRIDMTELGRLLDRAGFSRTGTVIEHGEYAVRGGIIDVFPPGRVRPLRLDFFGDTLEHIKQFDPETQRTDKAVNRLTLIPTSELSLDEAAIKRFRAGYIAEFGAVTTADQLYEAVSAGQRVPGMEHWLPLMHESLETLFDYLPGADVSFDHLVTEAVKDRLAQIEEHYQARKSGMEAQTFGAPPYKPLPPDRLYIGPAEWPRLIEGRRVRQMSPFEAADAGGASLQGRTGRTFAAERASPDTNLFDAVVAHIAATQKQGRRVLVAGWSKGARERLGTLLKEHGCERLVAIDSFAEVRGHARNVVGLIVLGLEHGFEMPDLAVLAEEDILGDRLIRPRRTSRKPSDVLTEATSLSIGDLVVHADHGIARFAGLTAITAAGAPHDCLELHYHGGDKLYLPVENIELLARYGSDETGAQLDRLGGVAWQSRKARLKKRLREIAGELLKVAAVRATKTAPVLEAPEGLYHEFASRFPHEETEDQEAAIHQALEDLAAGRPMDRLICGDVGFGKTEVALRAAFAAVMAGTQVAVVVPTTLLARQHFKTFSERFKGLPVKVRQASRLVAVKELNETKAGLTAGDIDIVVGTHVLLGKQIAFQRLGLLVVDEEQHFGVVHKERLKQLKEDVHVLTMTATPIPRTLQLALSGVREMSVIMSPPVDRLAVRTYVAPFDPVTVKDALLRERFRGGQSFYVCPRIADLEDVAEFLREAVPELKFAIAHGQLSPTELEDVMSAFYDGQYDVLLSTAIVESGLDIPRANTLIVHRADMFGLAQLYQLRGRVGRSKTRAYAYFTMPPGQRLTEGADKRLKVLQSLDTLGAGFALASHDLDIRGAGNLLGEEQSGHIREVGFELYQSMLEETIASVKGGETGEAEEAWSPQISLGTSVLIPEPYVSDLQLRLGLYRRLSNLSTREEIDGFAAELADRFGPLPEEVAHLLEIVEIKALCRAAGVATVDAGPKGASVSFRKGRFANPEGLMRYIQGEKPGLVKLQPDMKLIVKGEWEAADRRLKGVRAMVRKLAEMAAAGKKAA